MYNFPKNTDEISFGCSSNDDFIYFNVNSFILLMNVEYLYFTSHIDVAVMTILFLYI